MKLAVRSNHFWIAFGLATVFWITAYFVPNNIVLLISNSLLLACSVAVGVAYLPAAWRAARIPSPLGIERLLLGIAYSWFFGAMWRLLSLFWITSGQPPELVNNDLLAFLQAGVCLGACYHLTSPGAIGGPHGERHPTLKWIVLGIVIGAAFGVAALLTLLKPDTSGLAHAIIPYLPR